jgi:nicotinamidase-related amidase
MRPALLVVDLQQAFFEGPALPSLQQSVWFANAAMPLFRAKGLPVVCVIHEEAEDGLVPGTPGFEPHASLQFEPSDLRIVKRTGSAFAGGTGLGDTLRGLGVDTVVILGYCAENCVLSTCRGARDEGFAALLLRDALASGHPERIPFVEAVNDGLSFGALKCLLA